MLGTAATSVAVVSVAAVGLMMLSGRIDVRRAATVIVGCFVIFGAASIASGIQSAAGGGPASYAAPAIPSAAWSEPPIAPSVEPWLPAQGAPLQASPPPPAQVPPPGPYNGDPFAGAAVPGR